ncbi:hypothetical protein ACWENQ_10230 [Nonomuraea sp. NPDC004354]
MAAEAEHVSPLGEAQVGQIVEGVDAAIECADAFGGLGGALGDVGGDGLLGEASW